MLTLFQNYCICLALVPKVDLLGEPSGSKKDMKQEIQKLSPQLLEAPKVDILFYSRRMRGFMVNNEPKVEQWGLWEEVDLRFGVTDVTNVNRKEKGKKETIRKAPNKFQI